MILVEMLRKSDKKTKHYSVTKKSNIYVFICREGEKVCEVTEIIISEIPILYWVGDIYDLKTVQ